MLGALREMPELTERGRGVFYRRSRAFLHFHEDASGHHVDVRLGADFERFRALTKAEQLTVLTKVRKALAP